MGRAADLKDHIHLREDENRRARVCGNGIHGSRGAGAGAEIARDGGDEHPNAGKGEAGDLYSALRQDDRQEEAGDGCLDARYLEIE